MTLATLADVLAPAARENYAVAGVVVLGWEDAVAYVQAAEETGCPLILQAGPGCRAHTPVDVLGPMFRHLAERATVPIVCHLDHGYSLEECKAGIEHGFTSVMFDGSKLSIEENIAITQQIVALAKPAAVSVEGEVGYVGYAAGARSAFSSPEEVARFDRESGADGIAISIGNVHLQTEKSDGIRYDLLREIEAVTSKPLVLHGGSGISEADRARLAATTRVSKFNIGTELRQAFGKALREKLAAEPEEFDRIEILKAPMAAQARLAGDILKSLRFPDY